ncbi:PAS domain-containing sensor histidine kinase [Methylobacterium sp. Leaf456]|uniref:PAS domain-containing sensor histidine kinase n=1 Tax=Methylobacterium sp. Leaf456 TaxID=1736382 RepID=UPI0006F5E05B|nr:PAS domain-containing sensor histidine kinase [Methylobacterium sp. Leaf456]KQT53568.1 PAS domain-containing sensor histidine kinase [Methylobacterium sp. Leaf456]
MTEDYEDLYRNAPFAYVSLDADGRIAMANDTLADWIGCPAHDLRGQRFRDLLTVGTMMHYETSYSPLLAMQGHFDEASLDLRTADGGKFAVFGNARVVRDADGQHLATRLALLKSTGRRLYEREILDARDRSETTERATQATLATERETSELREQFIAVLGHDLRNPLASISSGARLLQRDLRPERRTRLFEAIQGSVVRMSSLIDNVMDFARGRLGAGIPLDLRPDVMLGPILEQVVTELRIGVPDRAIETAFALPEPIRCDPSRIAQLVSNLLGNALTHGAKGEPVRMRAGVDGATLTISVANGGAPIPEPALARLFQPFFRGEVRPSQQGLGLGLHIASEIAKAHAGTLGVTSTPAETRFTFRMPLHLPGS